LVFLFYSSDMDEPPHVHVEYKEGGTMKIWIREKELKVAWVKAAMPRHKQTETLRITAEKRKIFLNNWYEFKETGKITRD
jgi:hypothetical protein